MTLAEMKNSFIQILDDYDQKNVEPQSCWQSCFVFWCTPYDASGRERSKKYRDNAPLDQANEQGFLSKLLELIKDDRQGCPLVKDIKKFIATAVNMKREDYTDGAQVNPNPYAGIPTHRQVIKPTFIELAPMKIAETYNQKEPLILSVR